MQKLKCIENEILIYQLESYTSRCSAKIQHCHALDLVHKYPSMTGMSKPLQNFS